MADTIALMKKRALEMAIRGELVERRPEEGTAEDTLKTIRLEKEYLIKTGEIKQSKSFSEVKESETPFQIPNSWKWVRLGEVVYNKGQKKPDKLFTYIDIASIDNKKQVLGQEENILRPENAPSRARKIVLRGDILYSTVRPYLHNMCIINREFSHEPIASTGFAVMRTPEGVENTYLFYYLLSPTFDMYANDTGNATGTAYPAINDNKLYNSVVPLPPLAEQKRIVAKIEEIFAVIDQIGTKKEEALSIIRNMRQTALQDAIMGVLVDQDENDEPASKLIQKIKSSKRKLIDLGERKKATKVEKITENLPNYEIPPSWEWVRVNELVEINLGFTYRPTYQEDGKLFLSVKDLTDTGIDLKNAKYISNEEYEKASYGSKPKKGDLLFGRVGTLGKPRIVDFEEEFCIFVSLGFFRSYDELNVNMYYLSYWMESQLFWQQVSMFVKGSAQQNLNTGWLKNFLIPLPPLSEQRRIVQKLDEIMAICNQMEAIFDGSSETKKVLKVAE